MRNLKILLCSVFVCGFLGCGRPADLPPLAKFQVTVTKDGSPAEGVTVTINSDKLPNKFDCYGATNSSGIATITTYFPAGKKKFAGAPVGEVKIGFMRPDGYGLEDPREATKGMSREESLAYAEERSKKMAANVGYIPIPLTDPLISPAGFTVVAGQNNTFTIELDDKQWDVPVEAKRL
ncbi:MAG: hypothetical protein ACRC2T_01200 [Thermoguttaceae bacterium]